MYPLSLDHASIIKNLLHNERLRYKGIDQPNEGIYFKSIDEAISRMDHPDKYYPS
jgi:hypothetical protein